MATNKNLRIAITTGDQDGIGPEVTTKALAKLGPQKGVHFYMWRSAVFHKKYLRLIDRKFKRITVNSWPEALKVSLSSHKQLVDICSSTPPPLWVEVSAQAAMLGSVQALVTAPLSKTLIADSGLSDIGHTDILARVSHRKTLFMAFLGKSFHVLLATGHIPLSQVSQTLTQNQLEQALRAGHHLLSTLQTSRQPLRLLLLGLNPHAGENGLIGREEQTVYLKALQTLKSEKIPVIGPLVPDAAFHSLDAKNPPLFVAPYHDQGLIPFKLLHKRTGCHITMGLPFLRTSVDHGTAKDIFDQNKADSSSMQAALKQAIVLSRLAFKPDAF